MKNEGNESEAISVFNTNMFAVWMENKQNKEG